MPLLDHLHPPMTQTHNWESFHAVRSVAMVGHLNQNVLGERHQAEAQVHVSGPIQVEVEVATFSDPHAGSGNHNELMADLGQGEAFLLPPTPTYAVAYRPARRRAGDQIDVWPLALRNAETGPLDLEVTYAEACARSRIR